MSSTHWFCELEWERNYILILNIYLLKVSIFFKYQCRQPITDITLLVVPMIFVTNTNHRYFSYHITLLFTHLKILLTLTVTSKL